jgi:hypothetical protein
MDNIARTDVYVNKFIARCVATIYVSDIGNKPAPAPWQGELVVKYVLMDFNHCVRFLDGWGTVSFLSLSLYTPEIVQCIYDLYEQSPVRTRHEAEVWAQGQCRWKLSRDPGLLENNGKAIEDILQDCADEAEGTELRGLFKILDELARNNVQALSPLLENFGDTNYGKYLTEQGKEWPDTGLHLARLRYKDYHDKRVARYSRELDSLRKVLTPMKDTIAFDTKVVTDILVLFYRVREIFRDLEYINTRESFFTLAPLLLLKTLVKKYVFKRGVTSVHYYPINVAFYNWIQRVITNMPIPDIDPGANWGKLYVQGHKEELDMFLPVAYKWMIDNKGKYEIGLREEWYPFIE